jgi:hypothetical protein
MLNHLTQITWRLKQMEITAAQRDAAAKATTDLLKAIDIKRVDEIRRGFELPPECLGFVAEIYAALLAAPAGRRHEILPMSSGKPLLPNETINLKGIVKSPFLPERLLLSNAGTAGGAADWIIRDIRVDGRTVFKSSGAVPGDMFSTTAIESFVIWRECREAMELDMTYIGLNKSGCPVFSAVVGMELQAPQGQPSSNEP